MSKYLYKLTIYVPPEKEHMVKAFIKAYKARTESASEKIIDFIEKCMAEDHRINPQTRLNQVATTLPICNCGKEAKYRVTWRAGGTGFLCEEHFRAKRAKHLVKGWREVGG